MTWQSKLLFWFRKNKRDLPWRRTRDPYKIWVSEIMLQQTTVETVIPYYQKFLKRFPTVQVLASASEEEILQYWSGLGYYSRARNLHRASQEIYEKYGGQLPKDSAELLKLPGIGKYTAGAIASLAFNKKVPLLDGNVVRVLARLYKIKEAPQSPKGQKAFWKIASKSLPPSSERHQRTFGDFNEALMELGATLCLPEKPLCLLCPLSKDCKARRAGNVKNYPKPKEKIAYKDVNLSAAIIRKNGKILLTQRPNKGLLKGMWEIPMVEGSFKELQRLWSITPLEKLIPVRHAVLNRRLKITPFVCEPLSPLPARKNLRWIFPHQIKNVPTSSMNRKIIASLPATFS